MAARRIVATAAAAFGLLLTTGVAASAAPAGAWRHVSNFDYIDPCLDTGQADVDYQRISSYSCDWNDGTRKWELWEYFRY
jgi:hypothetical protein